MNRKHFYQTWKIMMLLFLFGMIAGCLYFHLLTILKGSVFINRWDLFLESYVNWSIRNCFEKCYIFWPWMLICHGILFFAGILKHGKCVLSGICFTAGLLSGALETVLLLCYDIRSKLRFEMNCMAVLCVPMILSLIMLILAYVYALEKNRDKNNQNKNKQKNSKLFEGYVLYGSFVIICDLVYIFACSYVNF